MINHKPRAQKVKYPGFINCLWHEVITELGKKDQVRLCRKCFKWVAQNQIILIGQLLARSEHAHRRHMLLNARVGDLEKELPRQAEKDISGLKTRVSEINELLVRARPLDEKSPLDGLFLQQKELQKRVAQLETEVKKHVNDHS